MNAPTPNRLANSFGRAAADSWSKRHEHLTAAVHRTSRLKTIAEKVELHDRVSAEAIIILAESHFSFLRMQFQPTFRKPLSNSLFQALGLCFISAMANHIVRVALEQDGRELPAHPQIEGIVEIEIRQQRADDATLRRALRPLDE